MTLSNRFSNQLRTTRARRRLSQEALAAKTGFSVSYISMLEAGKRSPPLGTVELVASALKVEPIALLK